MLCDIDSVSDTELLRDAVQHQLQQARQRLLLLLGLIYDPVKIRSVRDHLRAPSSEKRAYATELLDITVDHIWRERLLSIFEDVSDQERLKHLGIWYPQQRLGATERLQQLAAADNEHMQSWLRTCATYALHQEDSAMLSTVEKILVLKAVSLFVGTPDEVLLEVTSILDHVEIEAGRALFAKGDIGTSMYIIVDGLVRVHDGEHTVDELGQGDFFGEMAVLDTGVRLASVTALAPTTLFRLDQDSLYELMEDRPEIARSIIRVLSARLRARVQDVAELSTQVKRLSNL